MVEQPVSPSRRFDQMPHAIQGGNQGLYNGWERRVTGYQPDHNGETMGRIDTPLDNRVMPPYGSPGALGMIPTEPGDRCDRVDQHPMMQVSATWTPSPYGNGRPDGGHDPLTDGPPEPVIRNLSLWYHRASGASRTRYMDVPDGRKFSPVGTQDGSATTIVVDSRIAMEPFQPDPKTGQHYRDSLRRIPPGPSHGWSAVPAVSTPVQDAMKRGQLKQQKNVRQNRLANSTYAGQTYSQQTAHVQSKNTGSVPTWRTRG
jgi:hypothetical protein